MAHQNMITNISKAKHRFEAGNNKARHRYWVSISLYKDIKQIVEHRLAQQKRGILTGNEINHIITKTGEIKEQERNWTRQPSNAKLEG